jgi:protein required for attachment to host cells
MPRFCLVVANAARCRLYHIAPTDNGGSDPTVTLDERGDYISSARRRPPGDALTDHPGSAHAPTGVRFGLDDHREERTRSIDRGFATTIAASLAGLLAESQTTRALLVASPRMLGELRRACRAALPPGIQLDELPVDLTRLSTPQLHDRLADHGLVPARERLARA